MKVQKELQNEHKHFLINSLKVIEETFLESERIVPRWVKVVSSIARKFF